MKTHRKNAEGAYCPQNTASSWLESRGGRARDGGAEGQVSFRGDRPRLRGRKARVSTQVEMHPDACPGRGVRSGPGGQRGAGAAGQENGSRPPSAQAWGRNRQHLGERLGSHLPPPAVTVAGGPKIRLPPSLPPPWFLQNWDHPLQDPLRLRVTPQASDSSLIRFEERVNDRFWAPQGPQDLPGWMASEAWAGQDPRPPTHTRSDSPPPGRD